MVVLERTMSTPNLFWFIPTHGDGRYLGSTEAGRATSHAYMRQIAQAADDLGYAGVLLPTGVSCEDAWIVASSMIPLTKRLKFLSPSGRVDVALAGGAHGGHLRPPQRRPPVDQRRHRRRSGRAGRGRAARRPRRPLRHHRRVPHRLARGAGRGDGRLCKAITSTSAAAGADPAACRNRTRRSTSGAPRRRRSGSRRSTWTSI